MAIHLIYEDEKSEICSDDPQDWLLLAPIYAMTDEDDEGDRHAEEVLLQ